VYGWFQNKGIKHLLYTYTKHSKEVFFIVYFKIWNLKTKNKEMDDECKMFDF
jgi:hypothetical protein